MDDLTPHHVEVRPTTYQIVAAAAGKEDKLCIFRLGLGTGNWGVDKTNVPLSAAFAISCVKREWDEWRPSL